MTVEAKTNLEDLDQKQSQTETLLGATSKMRAALSILEKINTKADFIALNAAIEAARSQNQTENFSLVADQVNRQALRTEELAEKLKLEITSLQRCALKATAIRYADIASDLIDKVDRNLFERHCDCQAWATFESIRNCAIASIDCDPEQAKSQSHSDLTQAAAKQLAHLINTYQVYDDVFLINKRGIVVAAGKRTSLVGTDLSRHEFFKSTTQSGKVHVSDMHESRLTGKYTVSYSAPIRDQDGHVIGVVSTRFNWSFAQEMIDSMPLAEKCKAYLVNRDGLILAGTGKKGTLRDDLSWLLAAEEAISGGAGYTIECARNGQPTAWGSCHTRGFAGYAGKGWSAIVCHPVEIDQPVFFLEKISRDSGGYLYASETANNDLVKVAAHIRDLVTSINHINNETNMLAVNASIQAGVAGAEGESFSVIASEIGKLAKQSEEFVRVVNSLTEILERCVQTTVAARLADAAYDTMDKIDRNLFERFCDIQAFASFDRLAQSAQSGKNDQGTLELLQKLHGIYEVYHDLFLLDLRGSIVSAAVRQDLVGQNQGDRDWFREAVRGQIVVTDIYQSKTIANSTVTFAAPLRSASGQIVGVMTSRFNCRFIYDILKCAIVGRDSRVVLVNDKAQVIGTNRDEGLIEENFAQLRCFKSLEGRMSGFTTENLGGSTGEQTIGYARTAGYNSYKGKVWSTFVLRPVTSPTRTGKAEILYLTPRQ